MLRKAKHKLLIYGVIVLLLLLVGISVLIYFRPETDSIAEINSYPVYVDDLYAADNELWMLRARGVSIPREYDIYRLGEDGQEQYVRSYPGKEAHWNRENERLYFLSDKKIYEFDPATGNSNCFLLNQEYERTCTVDQDKVFLQQELYGAVTMYSKSDHEERVLGTSGWVLGAYGGHLLTWDVYDHELTCYDYEKDEVLWCFDLSECFSSAPILCESGGDLYLANGQGGSIYIIPQFTEKSELRKTEAYARVLNMVSAEDYVIYAVNGSDFIRFLALRHDGIIVELSTWQGPNYYQDSSVIMEVYDGKLYCTIKTEEGLFSCDLINN